MCGAGLEEGKDGLNRRNLITRRKAYERLTLLDTSIWECYRSQLNGENVIAGMNAWAVGIIRYGAGVLD